MKFFEFIFLKRRLEQDKDNIIHNLQVSKKRNRPMWLVLFPEGTGIILICQFKKKKTDNVLVISDDTRLKSKEFADKLHMVKKKETMFMTPLLS